MAESAEGDASRRGAEMRGLALGRELKKFAGPAIEALRTLQKMGGCQPWGSLVVAPMGFPGAPTGRPAEVQAYVGGSSG